MKLSDLRKVVEISNRRAALRASLQGLDGALADLRGTSGKAPAFPKVVLGEWAGEIVFDIPYEAAEPFVRDRQVELRAEIASVEADLAALGVVVDDEDEP
jgi:hypothetical protein